MNFTKILAEKNGNAFNARPATLAFLGDSVTNGCFEVYPGLNADGREEGYDIVFEPENSYANLLKGILQKLYPKAQLNLINAGISGDNAPSGLARMERDLLPYRPDLTVVCYGLNDSCSGDAGIEKYGQALVGIIRKLQEAGSEVILLTPQPCCTRVHSQLRGESLRKLAKELAESFESGGFERYMQEARRAAAETGVPLCDCCRKWMLLHENGVDITELLSNYLNHPTRDMHRLFAYSLAETIFGN